MTQTHPHSAAFSQAAQLQSVQSQALHRVSPREPNTQPIRETHVYDGVASVISSKRSSPPNNHFSDETRYTPSSPSQQVAPSTYEQAIKSQLKQLRTEQQPPTGDYLASASVTKVATSPVEASASAQLTSPSMKHTTETFEHKEPHALRVFKDISNNSEGRQENFQRVNLFI